MGSPANTDRVLIGVCAVIWLVLLGTGVAALVALVDLGSGHSETSRSGNTPWLLYVVAVVSALIILAAVPLLLRSRQAGAPGSGRPRAAGPARTGTGAPRPVSGRAVTEKLRVPGLAASEPTDRIWLRGTVILVGAVGAALIAVAVATNLMAVGRDGLAWAGYGVAGALTVAMPVIPWLYLRQLRGVRAPRRRSPG